jgi:hypothetical protein
MIKADKKDKDTNGLKHILQDLKMELNDAESWVSRYESLIDEVKDALTGEKVIK